MVAVGRVILITLTTLLIAISILLLTTHSTNNKHYEIMKHLTLTLTKLITFTNILSTVTTKENPKTNAVVELKQEHLDLIKSQLDNKIFLEPLSANSVKFILHQNGNAEPCGESSTKLSFYEAILNSIQYMEKSPSEFTKYDVDAILTSTFAYNVLLNGMCGEGNLLEYCDMGVEKTPILPDHNSHVKVFRDGEYSLPCHFHTREGLRITSFSTLLDIANEVMECNVDNTCNNPELHLYAVPAGRVFHFAPSFIGEVFNVPHVSTYSPSHQISLEVLSLTPRIFDVKNFFSEDEANQIITNVLAETSDTHKIKRSSTGATGYTVNSRRTSENGFDTSSKVALTLKERCFSILGIDTYDESFADGLQVLRYNVSTAYVAHQDYMDDPNGRDEHDYDSVHVGTNRFATILLYMSDLPDDVDGEDSGGQVVFPKAVLPHEGISEQEALEKIQSSQKLSTLFKRNSWEEDLLVQCQSKLAIKPYLSRAILFYSQYPNGEEDLNALHGACPVIGGTKWAANLWVWNGPRNGYPNAPVNHKAVELNARDKARGYNENMNPTQPKQLHASFRNTGTNPKYKNAKLYYEDTFWGNLGFGDEPLGVNTFKGHRWNVRVDDIVFVRWVIDERDIQFYEI